MITNILIFTTLMFTTNEMSQDIEVLNRIEEASYLKIDYTNTLESTLRSAEKVLGTQIILNIETTKYDHAIPLPNGRTHNIIDDFTYILSTRIPHADRIYADIMGGKLIITTNLPCKTSELKLPESLSLSVNDIEDILSRRSYNPVNSLYVFDITYNSTNKSINILGNGMPFLKANRYILEFLSRTIQWENTNMTEKIKKHVYESKKVIFRQDDDSTTDIVLSDTEISNLFLRFTIDKNSGRYPQFEGMKYQFIIDMQDDIPFSLYVPYYPIQNVIQCDKWYWAYKCNPSFIHKIEQLAKKYNKNSLNK